METPNLYDTVVIGGGPAGYSAALYAVRASLATLVIEQGMPGGQIATSDVIDNYPGIPNLGGAELGMKMQQHAQEAGAETAYAMVTAVRREADDTFTIEAGAARYRARSVIMATGATPRPAGFKGEERFKGRGISYCATCDGMFYRGKHVFVVGGGNTACEEAIYLSNIARSVEMVVRRDAFRAPRGMVERALARENLTVRYLTSIEEVRGDALINTIVFRNNATGTLTTETFDAGTVGIFVFTGNDPVTSLVADLVDVGPDGGVLTDETMATRMPGLFCAGDMRSKVLRQVVTAAADGAIAGTGAYRYVEERFRSQL